MQHAINAYGARFPGEVSYVQEINTRPYELQNAFNVGFVAGGGVMIRGLPVRVSPEMRYTRWGRPNFSDLSDFRIGTQMNQVEFLIGFTF